MTVGYITGFIWGLYFKVNVVPVVFLSMIGSILLIKKNEEISKYKHLIYLFLIFMIISNLQIISLENKFNTLYKDLSEIELEGVIISDEKRGEYKNSYTVKVKSVNKDRKYKNTKLIIYTKENLEYGTRIKLKRRI